MCCLDGLILIYVIKLLLDGNMLIGFVDVLVQCLVEIVLCDCVEVFEIVDCLKIEFVKNVSY